MDFQIGLGGGDMQKKPFMIIVLVILLAQPFVVVSSMPFAFSENVTSPEKEIVVSQGTRLEGGDLTDHVPILIDEEADFTTQGWPGAGTVGDPYVISGLNITYDHPFDLIRIFNVDSYFVIRDCYLGIPTGTPDWAIHLENVTDALIEYITIRSELLGILLQNANDTIDDYKAKEVKRQLDEMNASVARLIKSGVDEKILKGKSYDFVQGMLQNLPNHDVDEQTADIKKISTETDAMPSTADYHHDGEKWVHN